MLDAITRHYHGPREQAGGIIIPMPRGRPRTTPLPAPRNRLREWRERKQLSIVKLSKLTHPTVPPATIQRHESGGGVDTRYLEIYAAALGLKTEELLPTTRTLSDEQRELLDVFDQLAPAQRQQLIQMAHVLSEPPLKTGTHSR